MLTRKIWTSLRWHYFDRGTTPLGSSCNAQSASKVSVELLRRTSSEPQFHIWGLFFLHRQMRCFWRLRSRTSPPRPCSWRRCRWSRPWCTTSPSSTPSRPRETGKPNPKHSNSKGVFFLSYLCNPPPAWSPPSGRCPTCSPWTRGSTCTAWSQSRSTPRRRASSKAWRWSASWTLCGRQTWGREGGCRPASCREWYDRQRKEKII